MTLPLCLCLCTYTYIIRVQVGALMHHQPLVCSADSCTLRPFIGAKFSCRSNTRHFIYIGAFWSQLVIEDMDWKVSAVWTLEEQTRYALGLFKRAGITGNVRKR